MVLGENENLQEIIRALRYLAHIHTNVCTDNGLLKLMFPCYWDLVDSWPELVNMHVVDGEKAALISGRKNIKNVYLIANNVRNLIQ